MTKIITVILLLSLFLVAWLFVKHEESHESELEALRKQHLIEINKEHAKAEEWRQRALEYGNAFRAEATRALKAENRFNYLREENEKLKIRPVIRYTDNNLDSLFRARYSKD